MNNAVCRKTMENVRSRINVRLVNNKNGYLKCTSKPSYTSHKIFNNNLVAIRKSKVPLKLNKPAYIGMCILELSKVLMYKFHYDYIKNEYDNKSKILLSNANSSMYEIKTGDVYKDFSTDEKMFDFSNCSIKSKYYYNSNKLVIGKMKDETGGVAIEEFAGLNSFLVDNKMHKISE